MHCAAILAGAYASTAFESHGLILYPLIRIEYTRVQYCAAKSASASHCLRPTIASGELHERSRHPSWGPSSSTGCYGPTANHSAWRDRKSTRLNSSHVAISYAV